MGFDEWWQITVSFGELGQTCVTEKEAGWLGEGRSMELGHMKKMVKIFWVSQVGILMVQN